MQQQREVSDTERWWATASKADRKIVRGVVLGPLLAFAAYLTFGVVSLVNDWPTRFHYEWMSLGLGCFGVVGVPLILGFWIFGLSTALGRLWLLVHRVVLCRVIAVAVCLCIFFMGIDNLHAKVRWSEWPSAGNGNPRERNMPRHRWSAGTLRDWYNSVERTSQGTTIYCWPSFTLSVTWMTGLVVSSAWPRVSTRWTTRQNRREDRAQAARELAELQKDGPTLFDDVEE